MIVTHDIDGGLLMCNRVAMLSAGMLRFCGTPDQFRRSDDPYVRAFADREGAETALDNQLNVV
jgi:ABC-type transporter Mla maintaining outer membrane lipid asymmetry ATPase subunit MlaF